MINSGDDKIKNIINKNEYILNFDTFLSKNSDQYHIIYKDGIYYIMYLKYYDSILLYHIFNSNKSFLMIKIE